MDSSRFDGKCLMVTGGAGEIGLATAKLLARQGARVALVDIVDTNQAEAILKSLTDEVRAYRCDVSDYAQVERTTLQIVQDFGRIDLLFNNAGIQGQFAPIHKYPVEDFMRVIQVNLLGVFHVLRAVSESMVANGGGLIVNMASMAGVDAPVNMAAYGASKHGVAGLSRIAAKDLAPHNIRVNSISPGYMGPGFMWERQVRLQAKADSQYYAGDESVVAKQMIGEIPMRRYGSIEEIPPVVAFLLSEESSYVNGDNIKLSGGI